MKEPGVEPGDTECVIVRAISLVDHFYGRVYTIFCHTVDVMKQSMCAAILPFCHTCVSDDDNFTIHAYRIESIRQSTDDTEGG